jgi:hypothetical protein
LNRPFVQRLIMSPEFTANESGTCGTSSQSPDGIRTWRPGTSVCARNVRKLSVDVMKPAGLPRDVVA